MTDDELAAVDAWLDDLETGCDGFYIEVRLVRALRDEVARLRGKAEDFAANIAYIGIGLDPRDCPYCRGHYGPEHHEHHPECPITAANVWLASEPTD